MQLVATEYISLSAAVGLVRAAFTSKDTSLAMADLHAANIFCSWLRQLPLYRQHIPSCSSDIGTLGSHDGPPEPCTATTNDTSAANLHVGFQGPCTALNLDSSSSEPHLGSEKPRTVQLTHCSTSAEQTGLVEQGSDDPSTGPVPVPSMSEARVRSEVPYPAYTTGDSSQAWHVESREHCSAPIADTSTLVPHLGSEKLIAAAMDAGTAADPTGAQSPNTARVTETLTPARLVESDEPCNVQLDSSTPAEHAVPEDTDSTSNTEACAVAKSAASEEQRSTGQHEDTAAQKKHGARRWCSPAQIMETYAACGVSLADLIPAVS